MGRLFSRRIRPVGLPPGSLLYTERGAGKQLHLSIREYGDGQYLEVHNASLEACIRHLDTPFMTWIHVSGTLDVHHVSSLGKAFHFHPLVMEDILSPGQRSKMDVYEEQIFIVTRLLEYSGERQQLVDEQVSIIFGPTYLISFSEEESSVFRPVQERLQKGDQRMRGGGSDYLAYAILDAIVDHYFVVLERLDHQLDLLEGDLIHLPQPATLQRIQHAKRDMILLRRAAWPMRDVINRVLRLESRLVHPTTRLYVHDLYDHIVQIIDIIESFRDVVAGMMDIYLSNINIRTNDIMKVLTVVSTIFVPLTFISSLYGMNFDNMPELHIPIAYPAVLSFMGAIAVSMLLFFRHKKWL